MHNINEGSWFKRWRMRLFGLTERETRENAAEFLRIKAEVAAEIAREDAEDEAFLKGVLSDSTKQDSVRYAVPIDGEIEVTVPSEEDELSAQLFPERREDSAWRAKRIRIHRNSEGRQSDHLERREAGVRAIQARGQRLGIVVAA